MGPLVSMNSELFNLLKSVFKIKYILGMLDTGCRSKQSEDPDKRSDREYWILDSGFKVQGSLFWV